MWQRDAMQRHCDGMHCDSCMLKGLLPWLHAAPGLPPLLAPKSCAMSYHKLFGYMVQVHGTMLSTKDKKTCALLGPQAGHEGQENGCTEDALMIGEVQALYQLPAGGRPTLKGSPTVPTNFCTCRLHCCVFSLTQGPAKPVCSCNSPGLYFIPARAHSFSALSPTNTPTQPHPNQNNTQFKPRQSHEV